MNWSPLIVCIVLCLTGGAVWWAGVLDSDVDQMVTGLIVTVFGVTAGKWWPAR